MRSVGMLFSSVSLPIATGSAWLAVILDFVSGSADFGSANIESNLLVPAGAGPLAAAPAFTSAAAPSVGAGFSSMKFVSAGLCSSAEEGARPAGRGAGACFSPEEVSATTGFADSSERLGTDGVGAGAMGAKVVGAGGAGAFATVTGGA